MLVALLMSRGGAGGVKVDMEKARLSMVYEGSVTPLALSSTHRRNIVLLAAQEPRFKVAVR
jgi:hypothetical protein